MATVSGGQPRRYTFADLERMPDDGRRYEIVDGRLLVSPSPSVLHQRIVVRLVTQLEKFAAERGGEVFCAPLDVTFGDRDVLQPDVLYIAPDRMGIVAERCLTGPPSLVIEVTSPSSAAFDSSEKLATYARYGVPEYWIVDPRTNSIVAYAEPQDGAYSRREASDAASRRSLTIPDLSLTIF